MGHAQHDEGPEHASDAVAAETFARLLGERWQTTGDGIYVLADEAEEATEGGEQTQSQATTLRPILENSEAPGSTRR